MATVPLAGWVTAVIVRVSPGSGSVSLASTSIALPGSSATVAVSSTATGASLGFNSDNVQSDRGGLGVRATEARRTGQTVEVKEVGVVVDLDGELVGTGVTLVGGPR